jgi:hypothetical protein
MLIWMVISILITTLTLGLIAGLRLAKPEPNWAQHLEYLNFDTLQTGDILIVSYAHPLAIFLRGISGTQWTHTGIYYVDPDDHLPYVLEGANYHDVKYYKRFFKIPFMQWYRINRYNLICCAHLNRPVSARRLWAAFSPFVEHAHLDYFSLDWIRFLRRDPYRPYCQHDFQRRFTCVEVTIRTLQILGVFRRDYQESAYFVQDILNGHLFDNQYSITSITKLCPGRAYVRGCIP